MDTGLKCELRKRLEKARISCPTCWRDYALHTVHHVCNPIVKCNLQGQVFRLEEYIPLDPAAVVMLRAQCDECAAAERKLIEPRKGKCPICNYEGKYVYSDDDPRCACCKIVTIMTPASEKVTSLPEAKKAKHLKLYLRVVRGDNDIIQPSDDITFRVEHFTDESMLTNKWQVLPPEEYGTTCRRDLGEQPLCDHLRWLRDFEGYDWSWVVEKRIDWMLLKYYYEIWRTESHPDLGEFTL